DVAPVTWPIGRGRSFAGTYDLGNNRVRRLDAADDAGTVPVTSIDDPIFDQLLTEQGEAATWREEAELAEGGLKRFDLAAFREGHLTPVFFGSALRNFGVRDLIDGLARVAPPPRGQDADKRRIEPTEPKMTGFVFKIQANMDPNHRDRIAFMRVCSGQLRRGMKARLVRTGKPIPLTAPQFFFAQDRAIADEAFAGDVVGIPNHGTLRIGDTLTEGEEIVFRGVPSFAPEIMRRIKLTDAMKAKKLREALQQMGEEGVVQVFVPQDGSQAIVGVVGALQLDVLKERLQAEYGLPIDYEMSRFSVCRWIESESELEIDRFVDSHGSAMAKDLDGAPVFMATTAFSLRYEEERWEKVRFTDVKDYQKRAV
ncbi:MAG: EF-Tu/IF-2/RF-3 family GTPase, partial [Methylobacterium sp.]